jgi:hypothetical protein
MPAIIAIDQTGLLSISKTEEEAAAGQCITIQHESAEQARKAVEYCWQVRAWHTTRTADGLEWYPEFAEVEAQ